MDRQIGFRCGECVKPPRDLCFVDLDFLDSNLLFNKGYSEFDFVFTYALIAKGLYR